MASCAPVLLVKDLNEWQRYSVAEKDRVKKGEIKKEEMTPMNDSWPAIPCGLIAKSLFTDTF